ncbi:MAG: hypothetical protein UU80_C0009G0005 [candidate division WWE3 bacterium GW2011_GWA1_41_8]|uniref:Uncharacterized protein n=3 Tax=Katanobacteria TaxID=422282 RepID=A0A0G1AAI8_UNCKA|nr:MAG: hypothetical protein UU80_C0009G0005 [candidate division WWE3 bacterium GW2011_GWA1_41_8]OGC57074.1 MAG: hypothetical protein A2976_01760 [candidate division WWE3 bacterium RIFCSPLOWO2_01_FULL_41_9]
MKTLLIGLAVLVATTSIVAYFTRPLVHKFEGLLELSPSFNANGQNVPFKNEAFSYTFKYPSEMVLLLLEGTEASNIVSIRWNYDAALSQKGIRLFVKKDFTHSSLLDLCKQGDEQVKNGKILCSADTVRIKSEKINNIKWEKVVNNTVILDTGESVVYGTVHNDDLYLLVYWGGSDYAIILDRIVKSFMFEN